MSGKSGKWEAWLSPRFLPLLGDELPECVVSTAKGYMLTPAGDDAVGAVWTEPFERRLLMRYWSLVVGVIQRNGWDIDGQRRVVDQDGEVIANDVEEVAWFYGIDYSKLTMTAALPDILKTTTRRWGGPAAALSFAVLGFMLSL